ncbi:MAG: Gfo/Idh/MocA family oxidoreductase [Clostridia bacterium]|nr:Gfo/Idh/MocA family oxidoreductase [Clostridia bacterium]
MKKYVLVGCGQRGTQAYAEPLVKNYGDCAKLCGVYDINPKRAALVSEFCGESIPVYDDFDKMLDIVKPDTVIIATMDCDHDYYAIRAMKAGCDVISEKPLTTTFEKAQAIKKTQDETGKDVTVTFNLRFHPFFKRIKEIISSGAVGEILSVHFEWMLNTQHGADYFRRWHRERKNSGSLLIHKSTHHFDLINWFLEDDPLYVNAFGTRRFYGSTREQRSERCHTCPYAKTCEFYLDISKDDTLNKLYLECEDADGYFRDKCVFSEEIDIEDSLSISVGYAGGAVMSYSLTAYSPYEGMRMILNGTKGRIEIRTIDSHSENYNISSKRTVKIFNLKGEEIDIFIPKGTSAGHGGADGELRDRLFRDENKTDSLGQMADLRAGMMSIGIGMAANLSLKEKRQVDLSEFFSEFFKDIK